MRPKYFHLFLNTYSTLIVQMRKESHVKVLLMMTFLSIILETVPFQTPSPPYLCWLQETCGPCRKFNKEKGAEYSSTSIGKKNLLTAPVNVGSVKSLGTFL